MMGCVQLLVPGLLLRPALGSKRVQSGTEHVYVEM